MSRATFKQFSAAYDAYQEGTDLPPGTEALAEIFGKSDEQRATDLLKLVKNGDTKAVGLLDQLIASLEAKKKATASIMSIKRDLDTQKRRLSAQSTVKKDGPYKWDMEGKSR